MSYVYNSQTSSGWLLLRDDERKDAKHIRIFHSYYGTFHFASLEAAREHIMETNIENFQEQAKNIWGKKP
jgi:hypothetical protein